MEHRSDSPPPSADECLEAQRMRSVRPADWRNPEPARRYGLVVIGAGTAGLTAARTAASLGARVALVERDLLGGTTLNIGPIPSKAIIRTSRVYAEMRDAARYGGCVPGDIRVDFPRVMRRMRGIRARLSRANSAQSLAAAGVDVFFGEALFTGGDTLKVDGATLRFRKALIATGARPIVPEIPGLAEAGYLTNENAFELREAPRRLLVIGGGPLGCEMAQAFCRLGVQTSIVQSWPLFLPREERDAAQLLSDAFARDGLGVRLNTRVLSIRVEEGQKIAELITDDYRSSVTADAILLGTGRESNVEGLDLGAAGVAHDREHGVIVDDFLRTSNHRIYAAGDVCLSYKFNDTAEATARMAARNALLHRRQRLSGLTIPWCTYTDPEIAHVGMYVREARARGISMKTFTVPLHTVHRAIADDEETGFVKIDVLNHTDRILGATIVAHHAGEMISEITLAMTAGIGLRRLARVIHPYPTQAAAIKMAADAYNRTLTARRRRWTSAWLRWPDRGA